MCRYIESTREIAQTECSEFTDWAQVHDEIDLCLKPRTLDLTAAATIPGAALSSLFALRATGAPWEQRRNLTVVVTSGAGGTGFIGIQLAKAYGAAVVVTATSAQNREFVKTLGADIVIDYHKQVKSLLVLPTASHTQFKAEQCNAV